MLKKKNKLVFIAVALFCSSLVLQNKSFAAGSTVSPAFLRFTISDKVKEQTSAVAIKNNNDVTTQYEVGIVDVSAASGSLVPQESVSELTKSLFTVSDSTIVLLKDQSKNVIVTAKNTAALPPGGVYAALTVKQKAVDGQKNSVNQAVSVGLFLVKEDGAIRSLELVARPHTRLWFTRPKTSSFAFKNNGNVDLVPRAVLTITGGTSSYAKALFNEVSVPLFAGQSKNFNADIHYQKQMLPGRYTVVGSYRYDGQQTPLIETYSVWYIPAWSVAICVSLLFMILIVIKKRKRVQK